MRLGYQRPLQATDLWKMDPSRQSDYLSTRFMAALHKRQKQAAEWNEALPTAKPDWRTRTKWNTKAALKRKLPAEYAKYGSDSTYAARRATLEAEWRGHSGRRHGSIAWSLSEVFPDFWYAGECLNERRSLTLDRYIQISLRHDLAHDAAGGQGFDQL